MSAWLYGYMGRAWSRVRAGRCWFRGAAARRSRSAQAVDEMYFSRFDECDDTTAGTYGGRPDRNRTKKNS